jgi:hypothetical protein
VIVSVFTLASFSATPTAEWGQDLPTALALIFALFVAAPLKSHSLVHTSDTTSTSRL